MAQVDPDKLRAAVDAIRALAADVTNAKGTKIGFGFTDETIGRHVLSLVERKLGATILTEVPKKDIEVDEAKRDA